MRRRESRVSLAVVGTRCKQLGYRDMDRASMNDEEDDDGGLTVLGLLMRAWSMESRDKP